MTWNATAFLSMTGPARGPTVLEEQPTNLSSLLLIYVALGAVVILWVRSNGRKRQQQASQMQSGLVLGAQVRTIGGLLGELVEITDEYLVIETTPGVKLRLTKQAIAGITAPAEPGEALEAEAEAAAEGDADVDAAAAEPTAPAAADEPSDAAPAAEPAVR